MSDNGSHYGESEAFELLTDDSEIEDGTPCTVLLTPPAHLPCEAPDPC